MGFFSNSIEIASVLFSLVFIVGIAKQKIWAWGFGIIASFLASILFFQQKLYSESYLQVIYVFLGIYGWRKWVKLHNKNKEKSISELHYGIHIIFIFLGLLLTYITGSYFESHTQAQYPYLDSFTTIFAIIATFLETRKVLSCWYYWLVVNPVSVSLYFVKDLYLYTILGIVFSLMSLWGLISWRKSL